MKTTTCAGLALALAMSALPAIAQEQEMRPYITGGYNYTFEDSSRASAHGDGYHFGVGKALNQYWGLEFGGFYNQFDAETGNPNNWREYGAKLDGLFFYSRNPSFSPYVGIGVGGARSDQKNTGNTSTDPFVDAGVGFFKYFNVGGSDFSSNFGLRADVRYRWLDADDIPGINGAFGEPIVKIGLVAALGPRPITDAAIMDSDGDGVPDDADLCPGTPKGVKVDAKGCPILVDSDGDGVPDDQDDCPNTPRGLAVDKRGCPVDSDRRFKITGKGADLRFEDVHFDFDKTDLNDYGKAVLDDAATVINGLTEKYPAIKVDISGHTDSVGTEGYNQGLSERRANVVKQYLLRKGVEAGRVSTYAYGESKPVATNDTDEGRAQNRRSELRTRGE